MRKRIVVWALGSISVGLCLLSIIIFSGARAMAGGANDELAVTAILQSRANKMMLLALLFGILAAVIGYFQKRGRVYR